MRKLENQEIEKQQNIQHDKLWKEAIEEMLEEFLVFFTPDLAEQVDFTKGYEFLEQELNSLYYEGETKDRRTDKLVKLYMKDESEQWILCHVEIQGSSEKDFEKRMFQYFYRIFDKHDRKIFVLTILSDSVKSYNPNRFSYKFLDTTMDFAYRTYKILEQTEQELEKSNNPFAYIVLVAWYFLQIKKRKVDAKTTYEFKRELYRKLRSAEWERNKIEKLFVFMDNMIQLPLELEGKFDEERRIIERGGEKEMGLNLEDSQTVQRIVARKVNEQLNEKLNELNEKLNEQLNEKLNEKIKEADIQRAKELYRLNVEKDIILAAYKLTEEEFERYVLEQK